MVVISVIAHPLQVVQSGEGEHGEERLGVRGAEEHRDGAGAEEERRLVRQVMRVPAERL